MPTAIRRAVGLFLGCLAMIALTTGSVRAGSAELQGYWQVVNNREFVVKVESTTANSYRAYVEQENRSDVCYVGPGYLVFELTGTGNHYTGKLDWYEQSKCSHRFANGATATFGSNGTLTICSDNPFAGGTPPHACDVLRRVSDCSSALACQLTASYAIVAAVLGGLIGSALAVPGLVGPRGPMPAAPQRVSHEGKSVDLEMAGLEAVEGQESALQSTMPVLAAAEGAVAGSAGTEGEAAQACNQLGSRLLDQLLEGDLSNICVSPVGAAIALGLAAEAATGDARRAIASVLGLSESEFGDNLGRLRASLQVDNTHVELATALWMAAGISPLPYFVDLARGRYGANVQSLDLSSPSAPSEMDSWVNQATHGKIQALSASLSADTALILASAVYFKGLWETPFDPGLTSEQTFTTPAAERRVAFMRRKGWMRYTEDDRFQFVSLDYSALRYSLKLLLPREVMTPEQLRKAALPQLNEALTDTAGKREGFLAMPRVHIAQELPLERALVELGLGAAMDPHSDFSGLSQDCARRCYVSEVRQACRLEIDEEGTTAAAATRISVAALAPPPTQQSFEMVVDRPFLLGLQDAASSVLIVLAAVSDPAAGA